jgi:hypothetical protein
VQTPAIRSAWPDIEGSKYAGIAAGQDGKPDYHLILLADNPGRELNWKDAIAWAEKLGASLPTRDESALLYAHLRGEFEGGWHWTGTQYSSRLAWGQLFRDGGQDGLGKGSGECRARAVRRLPLQSFNPSSEAPKPDTTNALLRQILDQATGLRTDLQTIFLGDTGVQS